MSKLRKRQIKFLGILAIVFIVYILARPIMMHLVYWLAAATILVIWGYGLYQSIQGKDPVEFWIEDDVKDKYDK